MLITGFIYGYVTVSFILCLFLIFTIIRLVSAEKHEIKWQLVPLFAFATIALGSYSLFLLSPKYLYALAFDTIYFICTDWMALGMLNFAIAYTKEVRWKRLTNFGFTLLAIIDTCSLVINFFTKHSFNIVPCISFGDFIYWGNFFHPVHYVHIGFCYVIVGLTFLILITQSLFAKKYYKRKYVVILFLYFFVIFVNFVCYTLNTTVDVSVIFYGALAYAICYYSTRTFPSFIVYSSLLNSIGCISPVIVDFDYDGNVVFMNAAAKRFFDVSFGVVRSGASPFRKNYLKNPVKELDLLCGEQIRHFSVEYKELEFNKHPCGSYLKLEDKTEERDKFLREKAIATHDELTGLYNRLGFFEAAQNALKEKKFRHPILLVTNIKDFKLINEIFGEVFGDSVLLGQATLMKDLAQENNIIGRLADDKFVIMMEKEDFDEERFKSEFESMGKISEDTAYQIQIFTGIYEIRDETESIQVMYDKAKMAMDQLGDNYDVMFARYGSNLMEKLLSEKKMSDDFETALENGDIEMYLQPFEDTVKKRLNAEALVRWKNSAKQELWEPEKFIGILEERGLLYKLDMYMCELAAKKLAEWKKLGRNDIDISVNISAKDKYYVDFVQFTFGLIEKYDFDAKNLCFEIPEIMLIEQSENTRKSFEAIRKLGFKIMIDGFGSEYSTLNSLKEFNIDAIKLNSNFFMSIDFSERNRIILETIIKIGQELNLKIVAKGVEKIEEINSLKEFGLSTFQGFFYEKPLSINEFEERYLRLFQK